MEDTSKKEILDAVNTMSTHMDKRFDRVDERLNRVEGDVSTLKSDVSTLKSDVSTLKSDVSTLKATMVDKDHLEDRLAKYHGDLVVLMRKEDTKVRTLVEVLREKQILTDPDVKRILALEPFPQLYL